MNTKQLNEQQQVAVETTDGPLLILAGAGSGKTTVAIKRIVYLLSKGVEAKNILAVTFTTKAANEMKERLIEEIGEEKTNDVWVHTFHSLCLRILKAELKSDFKIIDKNTATKVVYSLTKAKNYKYGVVDEIYKNIAALKTEMVSPIALNEEKSNNPFVDWKKVKTITKAMKNLKETTEIYPKYQEYVKKQNNLDMEDLIIGTISLFLKKPDILKKYQEQFQYVTIDEFQDTNRSQYALVKMLSEGHGNIAAIGDDFQSIFSFRNSDIRNILNFEKDFQDAVTVKLEQNYRSTGTIVEASNALIKQNKNQKEKVLNTENKTGEKIVVYEASSTRLEAKYVVDKIKKLQKNVALSEIAILFRNHTYTEDIQEELNNNGIPFVILKTSERETLEATKQTTSNAVQLLSVHSAKGLEFEHVFIIGCAEGIFPSPYAVKDGKELLEEERRLFYVSITRAKQNLTMSYCTKMYQKTRHGGKFPRDLTASRFIGEIPKKYLK